MGCISVISVFWHSSHVKDQLLYEDFFYLFFFLWEWTIQSCWFIKKKLEHRKRTRSKVNLWINVEQEMFQGRYNNNLSRQCWCFAIWKKKKKRTNPRKGTETGFHGHCANVLLQQWQTLVWGPESSPASLSCQNSKVGEQAKTHTGLETCLM